MQFDHFLVRPTFWARLRAFIEESLLAERTVNSEDIELFHMSDSPEEAVSIIIRSDRE